MILSNKKQIRQEILKQRNVLPESQKLVAQAIAIKKCAKFLTELLDPKDKLAGYYPTGSEFNILPLFEQLFDVVKILLPVIGQSPSAIMKFYPWSVSSSMSLSKYANHILEPSTQLEEEIPTIIITPLVACDLSGNRIGSGKAMYDRTLAKLRNDNPNLLYIGLCYDFQLRDRIPVEDHDQRLDIIFTESREVYLSARHKA